MSTVVIGGSGQLGHHLRQVMPDAQFWDRQVIDLRDLSALEERTRSARPTAIVIAAAYTAVDKAESEPDVAWRVNAEAPAVLAQVARTLDIPLVHVSTDYVFDGEKADGYSSADPVRPLNQYGRSKLGGELAITGLCRKHWILRTSWVFSPHGNNFPKTMLRLARERDELKVVDDQRGQPTYAGHLARCIAGVLDNAGPKLPWGLHHVGSGPALTWKEFALRVLEKAASRGLLGRVPRVTGIATADYPAPAARPRNSILLTDSRHGAWTRDTFDWDSGLDEMLATLE